MQPFGRRVGAARFGGAGLLGVIMAAGLSPARAGDMDTRTFQISIDNKRAGQYTLTITPQDDGTLVVSGQAEVRVTVLGITGYRYSFRGTETWKGDRLLHLDSTANDDGKRFEVSANADGGSVRVRSNGRDSVVPGDVWTTLYWHLPDAQHRQGPVVLLDSDTGREIPANIQYVGTDQVNVAGQAQDCTHYRVTGGVQVDLWYDAQERMVRQEAIEEGSHRTLLECVGR